MTLANHGHPEYWGDMERLARNHLVESQVADVSWLKSDNARPDTEQFTWREIGPRVVGAWAGWTSPNHVLAYRETLNAHWGGPELRDKIRFLQNCCGGSGVHALFILWKNAARFDNGELRVNLHLDKKLPEAEIRCGQPYCGITTIALARDCAVSVRIQEPVALQLEGEAPQAPSQRTGSRDRGSEGTGLRAGVRGSPARRSPCRFPRSHAMRAPAAPG